jgi:hypothetical protein
MKKPASTMTAPGLIISAVISPGLPTALITTSALVVASFICASVVHEWQTVTLALNRQKNKINKQSKANKHNMTRQHKQENILSVNQELGKRPPNRFCSVEYYTMLPV